MRLLLLSLVLALAGCRRAPKPSEGPVDHVVLVVIDTLRADTFDDVDTPEFDRFARHGSGAQRAWSASTWTAPGVISLFTGAHVRTHGWDHPFPGKLPPGKTYPPIPDLPVLAEVLRDRGFTTKGRFANPLLGRHLDFERGFDSWSHMRSYRQPGWVAGEVARWQPGERHSLYLHLFGCHTPLMPSTLSRLKYRLPLKHERPRFGLRKVEQSDPAQLDEYRRAYRACSEDYDHLVGELLAALRPVMGRTAIVITSDHGEVLGEHGHLGHGSVVWEGVTHVPLATWNTDAVPSVVPNAVAADLLTRAAGIDHDWPLSIDDPGPLVSQREGKLAFSEDGRIKGIWDPEAVPAGGAAFDLEQDPGERRPLDVPVALDTARTTWEAATVAGRSDAVDGEIDAETQDVLQALGYVDDEEATRPE